MRSISRRKNMVKIEAESLEHAYAEAAQKLECSVTELQVEIIRHPSKGMFGFFRKTALIVANCKPRAEEAPLKTDTKPKSETLRQQPPSSPEKQTPSRQEREAPRMLNDTILPESFVTGQDETEGEAEPPHNVREESVQVSERFFEDAGDLQSIVEDVRRDINALFDLACFDINPVDVSLYDDNTLLVEFSGEDAALLIGKEGYRYKALSYMIFNWINAKYQMQLRLEIAEFLKNQEESIARYLVGVCENIERDGRAQTKVLDGVLVQIALKQLRTRYPDKYVAIRSTRDGAKFIIINSYNEF